MAKDIVKPEAEKPPAAEIKKPEKVQRYSLEKLREHSKELFGVDKFTFDGASHGKSGNYTVEEMKNIIDTWKKKEAK